MAVRRATSAVASLSSDSASRMVTTCRGRPILRATDVAATASGGATMAPAASASGQPSSGTSSLTTAPTPKVVTTTSPTDSSRTVRALVRTSINEVWIAAEYSRGGNRPNSTISGVRWMWSSAGRKEPATPSAMSSSGAGTRSRSLTAAPPMDSTASTTRITAFSMP